MEIAIIVVCMCVTIGTVLYSYQLQKNLIEINTERQVENEKIEEDIERNQRTLQKIKENIVAENETYRLLNESIKLSFQSQEKELEATYRQKQEKYDLQLQGMVDEIAAQQNILLSIESKQKAYMAAQVREEKKQKNIDFYRLNIATYDKDEIQLLRQIQEKFIHKEAIDKLIWDVYYKTAYDELMPKIFSERSDKVCGVYKITNIENGQAYIG